MTPITLMSGQAGIIVWAEHLHPPDRLKSTKLIHLVDFAADFTRREPLFHFQYRL